MALTFIVAILWWLAPKSAMIVKLLRLLVMVVYFARLRAVGSAQTIIAVRYGTDISFVLDDLTNVSGDSIVVGSEQW